MTVKCNIFELNITPSHGCFERFLEMFEPKIIKLSKLNRVLQTIKS